MMGYPIEHALGIIDIQNAIRTLFNQPQLPLRRRHCSSEFPRHLCTACPRLVSITTAALSRCLLPVCPALALAPPPAHLSRPPPPPPTASAHPNPAALIAEYTLTPTTMPFSPMCSYCPISHIFRGLQSKLSPQNYLNWATRARRQRRGRRRRAERRRTDREQRRRQRMERQ